jgi:hypothetical protein
MSEARVRGAPGEQARRDAASGPSVRHMLGLWVPLAASIVMMVLEPSIINIGLGRTINAELALAAYGVAFSLALLVEAPILMLLDASVARASDREAFALIRRFSLGLGLVVTAVGLVLSFTPLYDVIVLDLMNIPVDVAGRARPTLQILSFWSLPIAWRRAHQGVLIRNGRTAVITAATGVRLVTLAGALFGGLYILPDRGAVVAGIAMDISVVTVQMGVQQDTDNADLHGFTWMDQDNILLLAAKIRGIRVNPCPEAKPPERLRGVDHPGDATGPAFGSVSSANDQRWGTVDAEGVVAVLPAVGDHDASATDDPAFAEHGNRSGCPGPAIAGCLAGGLGPGHLDRRPCLEFAAVDHGSGRGQSGLYSRAAFLPGPEHLVHRRARGRGVHTAVRRGDGLSLQPVR